jgi:hypothetical protein
MHWNVSIGPEKWPIFSHFLTLFPLKRPAQREKNTSNMAATIGDVMDDVTPCKSSIPYSIHCRYFMYFPCRRIQSIPLDSL